MIVEEEENEKSDEMCKVQRAFLKSVKSIVIASKIKLLNRQIKGRNGQVISKFEEE